MGDCTSVVKAKCFWDTMQCNLTWAPAWCPRSPGVRTPPCPAPGAWGSRHTGQSPLSSCHCAGDVRAGSSAHCDIVIPWVPTHPGDQLSAPATTGHTALRGWPMGPAESGICFTVFDLLNCVLCLPNTILIFMAFEHKYKCLIKLNFSLLWKNLQNISISLLITHLNVRVDKPKQMPSVF